MIIVEDRFKEMFEYLPAMPRKDGTGSFKVSFNFGDGKELNAFLQRRDTLAPDPYPLIWLLYPQQETHYEKYVELKKVSLILAVKTTADKLNEQRFNDTFRPTLFPLNENIAELFKKSNTISVNRFYELIKYPNYGELNVLRTKEQEFTTDIWDAIKITFDCQINDSCLRQINF